MTTVKELKYSVSNNYLIKGTNGNILFDTGWAGSFPKLCKALRKSGETLRDIRFLLISHFHPDHMGIARDIAEQGVKIVILDVQRDFVHGADGVFLKEKKTAFRPVIDEELRVISAAESRAFLKETGTDGEIVHTPGHSADSISLCLDDGQIFVGDLNPLYELDVHKGTQIEKSWRLLLSRKPEIIYYGHAKTAVLSEPQPAREVPPDLYSLIIKVMDCIDRDYSLDKTVRKTHADRALVAQIVRMCMTHPNVGAEGILDRIENTRRKA